MEVCLKNWFYFGYCQLLECKFGCTVEQYETEIISTSEPINSPIIGTESNMAILPTATAIARRHSAVPSRYKATLAEQESDVEHFS